MNMQQLHERVQAIQAEMEQTKANYAKLEGHLNETLFWIQKMIEDEQKLKEANEKIEEAKEQVDGQVVEQGAEQAA